MLDKAPGRRPTAAGVLEALNPAGAQPTTPRPVPATARRVFVGRETERAELLRCLERAEAGCGLCAFLGGEPGIGKTTLVEEFLAEVSNRPLLVARGSCSERVAASEGYLPLLEALDSLLRGPRARQNGRLMRLLAPSWYALVYSPSRDSVTGPAETDGSAAPPERMKRDLAGLFEELSHEFPVVLFLDDLQWADLSTIDMLAHLAGRSPSMRLLILGTFRPTDLALAKHPLLPLKQELVARGIAREIPMGFLNASDISRYLDLNFSGHCFPPEFVELLRSRTEGNPPFMVDLLRDLRDEGSLAPDEVRHGWRLARDLTEIAGRIPGSVQSLIERKIDRLSEEERRLLGAGAVQGCEFDTAVLSKALGLDPADVEDELSHLEREHGLVRQIDEREMPDGTLSLRYQFVHVLYQNALYDLLRPTRRAALNGAVAEAIIALYGGRHHEQAIELALLFEAARNPARAAEYFLIASRQSAQVSAHEEAIATGRRGLQLLEKLPPGPQRTGMEIAFHLAFGPAMVVARGYADSETEQIYNTALELTRQAGSPAEMFQALLGLSAFYFFRPRLDTAKQITEQATRIAEQAGDLEILVWANVMRASVLSHIGEFVEARTFGERACACYDRNPRLTHISRAVHDPGVLSYSQTARIEWIQGSPDRALNRVGRAVQIGRDSHHGYTLGMALFFLSWIHQHRREPAEAAQVSAETLVLAKTRGFVNLQPWVASVHGWAVAELGSIKEGIAEMRGAIEALEGVGAGLILPQFLGTLAETLAKGGRPDEGLPLVEKAFRQAEKSSEHCFDAELFRIEAKLQLLSSPGADVEPLLLRAHDVARSQGALAFELRAATDLARLGRARGTPETGLRLLQSVYSRFTEGFASPDLQEAAALLQNR
jgi:tetratricopeptide (TPR) repeat protein